MNPKELIALADDADLLEVGRKAVESTLIQYRDNRISAFRNNGLVIREKDGRDSCTIRLGAEQCVAIALRAIASHLEGKGQPDNE